MTDLIKRDAALPAISDINEFNSEFAAGTGGAMQLPRLSIRGRRFRIVMGKEETLINETTLRVVIIAGRRTPSSRPSKIYFDQTYSSGSENSPLCWSKDGVRPDADVPTPQSDNCATCRWNAFGSAKVGKGKACSDYKLLVVAPINALQMPLALNVPATSLKKLDAYVRLLTANKLPVSAVVTELSFADSEYPQLEFKFVEPLSEEQLAVVMETRALPEVVEATTVESAASLNPQQPNAPALEAPQAARATDTAPAEQSANKTNKLEEIVAKWRQK